MKKILYYPIIILFCLFTLSSCNEEDPCNKDSDGNTAVGSTLKSEEDCNPDPDPDGGSGSSGSDLSFQSISEYIIDIVDDRKNNDELGKFRDDDSFAVDRCHDDLQNNNRFSDAIAFFVEELVVEKKVQMQYISQYYGMQKDDSTYYPVSLISHPFCRVTESTLNNTIKDVPGPITIGLAQRFADDYNEYRTEYRQGNLDGLASLKKLWGTFYGCLAYTESLTTADTSRSYSVAAEYGPSGYRKPAGVKFYEDPRQSEASRLNIGLFQFTPDHGGNIRTCIDQWNKDYSSCKISSGGRSAMIPVVGSSLQHFNSYCGVQKLAQTFAIQVNSIKQRNSHPDNHVGSGLKSSSERCVTPFFYSGWAYNHYGPLQNSSGSNLNILLRCIYPQQ